MALCPLQGKELSRLMFVFLGDAQRLGPSEVKATKGQPASQALRHPSTPAASPSELLPAKESQDSPTARILGPAATVPPSPTPAQKEKKKEKKLARKVPPPGSWHPQNCLE